MPRMMSVGGMKVKPPKGGMSGRAQSALSKLMSGGQRLQKSAKCTIVFFKGGSVAAQRCEGRKLKATNRRQCRRGGKGPKAHLFASCGGARRRRGR